MSYILRQQEDIEMESKRLGKFEWFFFNIFTQELYLFLSHIPAQQCPETYLNYRDEAGDKDAI